MIKSFRYNNSDNKNDNLVNIEYFSASPKLRELFDKTYRFLCENDKFKNFVSSGIYGKYDETLFSVYKDIQSNNKICIIFIEKNNSHIICLDSTENGIDKDSSISPNKYLRYCNYYSKKEMEKKRYIETKGLGEKSKNYYKIQWENLLKEYQILLKQEKEKYIYEITMKENKRTIKIRCIWDDYEQFLNKNKPSKIEITDKEKCYLKPDIEIINIDTFEIKEIQANYGQIEQKVRDLGLSLYYDKLREETRKGEKINDAIPQILYAYFETIIAQKKRKDIIKINHNYKKKVFYDEEAIIETKHLSRRHSIQQRTNR